MTLLGPVTGAGGVDLIASTGSILSGAAGINVISPVSVSLSAGKNIGAELSPLNTQTPLWLSLKSGGSMYLGNYGAISTGSNQVNSGGTTNFTAHSPLTIGSGGLTSEGSIYLTAAKSIFGLLPDDLTINGAVTSKTGSIYLKAGGKITVNAMLSAPGGVFQEAGEGSGLENISQLPSSLIPALPLPPLFGDPGSEGSDVLAANEEKDKEKEKDKKGEGKDGKDKDGQDDPEGDNYCN